MPTLGMLTLVRTVRFTVADNPRNRAIAQRLMDQFAHQWIDAFHNVCEPEVQGEASCVQTGIQSDLFSAS